jgi:hypothetical protein
VRVNKLFERFDECVERRAGVQLGAREQVGDVWRNNGGARRPAPVRLRLGLLKVLLVELVSEGEDGCFELRFFVVCTWRVAVMLKRKESQVLE